MPISVVVTTYNRPDALRAVLDGLGAQADRDFEVIVADDGSRDDTRALVEQASAGFPVPLAHVWQEDQGFRAGAARNRAAERARGEYLVFLDGDCIPRPDFIARHRALAERGWMVAGNRILLSEAFTARRCASGCRCTRGPRSSGATRAGAATSIAPCRSPTCRWARCAGSPRRAGSACAPATSACGRDDFRRVRGFDETFEGWGFEDSDLAVRLLNAGVRRKEGAFATGVLHLWHRENDRRHEGRNWDLLQQRIRSRETLPARGLSSPQA